jgi:hypothetical protein
MRIGCERKRQYNMGATGAEGCHAAIFCISTCGHPDIVEVPLHTTNVHWSLQCCWCPFTCLDTTRHFCCDYASYDNWYTPISVSVCLVRGSLTVIWTTGVQAWATYDTVFYEYIEWVTANTLNHIHASKIKPTIALYWINILMAFIGHTIPARTFKFKTHTNVNQVHEAKVHVLVSNPAHLRVPRLRVPSHDRLAGQNSRYSVTACPLLV